MQRSIALSGFITKTCSRNVNYSCPSIRGLSYTAKVHNESDSQGFEKSKELIDFEKDEMKIISIPLNTEQNYLHYIQNDQLLKFDNKIAMMEKKVAGKASSFWNGLKASDKAIAKFTVKNIEKLLDRVPWSEQSYASIPFEQFMIKRRSESEMAKKIFPEKEHISFVEYMQMTRNSPSLIESIKQNSIIRPIKIYSPRIPGVYESDHEVSKRIYDLAEKNTKYFKKEMFKCMLALPLTFPLAIIPLVPNVPGFYLCYRLYWNLKAHAGCNHIMQMYHKNNGASFKIEYVPEFTDLFKNLYNETSKKVEINSDSQQQEFEKLAKIMEFDSVKANVLKAVIKENYE
ncbi:uncharacterized protein HGUI_00834 [Hanseniaspora guilliermondii]|uniref:Uncharacterized protein n=1 Tax=Hanseniaspora guilliermondii TaxID=56406 RepID=A0A1L0AWB6_9ASCO|nr:uncharacterized protein HGUI_00834 [Hanseniaspora guilliermondii]